MKIYKIKLNILLILLYVASLSGCTSKAQIFKQNNKLFMDNHCLIDKHKKNISKYMVEENYRLYKKDFNYYTKSEIEFFRDSILLISLKVDEELYFTHWAVLTKDSCSLFYFNASFQRLPITLPVSAIKYEEIIFNYLKKFGDGDPNEIIEAPEKP